MKKILNQFVASIFVGVSLASAIVISAPVNVSAAEVPATLYNTDTDTRPNTSCDAGSLLLKPAYVLGLDYTAPVSFYCIKSLTQTNATLVPATGINDAGVICPSGALAGYDAGGFGRYCIMDFKIQPALISNTAGSSDGSQTNKEYCEASGGIWKSSEVDLVGTVYNCENCPTGTKSNGLICSGSGQGAPTCSTTTGSGSNCISYAKEGELKGNFLQCTTAQATNGDCIKGYINLGIKLLGGAVGIVITMMIIIGGIQYAASGGDPSAVAAAKKRIVNALLALLAFIFMGSLLNFLVPGGIF